MTSYKEIRKLVADMNLTDGCSRPSRNSQGICNASIQPTITTTTVPEILLNIATVPHSPVKNHWLEVLPLKVTVLQSWTL